MPATIDDDLGIKQVVPADDGDLGIKRIIPPDQSPPSDSDLGIKRVIPAPSPAGFFGSVISALSQGQQNVQDAQRREDSGLSKPLLNISPKVILGMAPGIAALGTETGTGVAKGIAEMASGMTSPESLAIVAGAAVAPEVVGGVLTVLGAEGAVNHAKAAIQAWREGRKEEAGKEWAIAGGNAFQAAAPLVGKGLEVYKGKTPPLLPTGERVPAVADVPAIEPSAESPAGAQSPQPSQPRTASQNVQAIGIVPPGSQILTEGAKAISDTVKETAAKLDQTREGFQNAITSSDVKSDITRKLDAADNEARIEGDQIGNSVRLEAPIKADREAITFIVEANGDRLRLADFAAKIGDKNKTALSAVRLAERDWDRLSPVADKVNQLHDEQLRYEQDNGVDPGEVEGYVRHAYDMDAMIGQGRPVLLSSPKGKGIATNFTKQRTFDTYADAIEAGFKPRTFDVADLVQSRITIGERLLNRQKWAESLQSIHDPVDNVPIVTALKVQNPKGTKVAPMGYQSIQITPGTTVAVHEGYSDLLSSLTGTSRLQSFAPTRIALSSGAAIKHGLLLLDTFHAGRMLFKELALTKGLGHDLGRSLLEYRDEDLSRAVASREITTQAADYAREIRPSAETLVANGLNVGRVSDALYKDVVKNIPIIGPFNKWVFDKLTRGAMMQSALIEFERLKDALPDKTTDEVAGIVAKNVNEYFGNLGRQGIFKDPTLQDLARLVFIAPQWVEGMARTEAGAVKQLAQAPIDAARGKPFVMGTLAKGVGSGVAAMIVATQLINLATRGHPTWNNPEHGHQMDAWIPDVTGAGTDGFFLNPLSIFAELTHDALRYYADDPHAIKTIARIVNNKLSPLSHAEEVLRTGKDWMGRDLEGSWDRIKESARALVPAPIPAQPVLPFSGKNAPPGSLQRQIFASLGIKTEPVPSAESQLFNLARRFKEENNLKTDLPQPSEYRDLNLYLRKEDWASARKEYDRLAAGPKSPQTILNHYATLPNQLFTGSRATESRFYQSLDSDQRELVSRARQERSEMRGRFFEMLQQEPK